MLKLVPVLLLGLCGWTHAQSADSALAQALRVIQLGDFSQGQRLLQQAQALLPEPDTAQSYNLALGHLLLGQPAQSLPLLHRQRQLGRALPGHYQLLGDAYQKLRLPDSARWAYAQGLKHWPHAGPLWVELGLTHTRQLEWVRAVYCWEESVRRDPAYAPAYYHLAKRYATTPNRVWTWIYAETFLHLEPPSLRTREVTRLLLAAFRDGLKFTSDTTFLPAMWPHQHLEVVEGEPRLSFELEVHRNLAAAAAALRPRQRQGPLSLQEIRQIRSRFWQIWKAQGLNGNYANALFSRLIALEEAGLGAAYDYSIWQAVEALDAPRPANEAQALAAWLQQNPLHLQAGQSLVVGCFSPESPR